mgnify:CR=1 FL=1
MKILIVDDEKIILEKLKMSVRQIFTEKDSIVSADNAGKALELILSEQPDIILTDIRMPGKDGLYISSFVHQNFPDKIVILITGFSDFKYAQTAIKNHVFDYILKPIDESILKESLQKAVHTITERKNQAIMRKKYETYLDENIRNLQKDFFERLLFRNTASISSTFKEETSMLRLNHIKNYYLMYCKCITNEVKSLEKEYYFTHIAEHYLQEQIPDALIFSYGNALYSLCPNIDEIQLTKVIGFIHSELKKNGVLMSAAVSSYSETLSDIPLLRNQTMEIFNVLKNSEHFVMLYRDLESSPVMGMYEKSNYFQMLLNTLSAGDSSALQKRFQEISHFFAGESSDEFNSFMYSFMTLFLSFFQSPSQELSESVHSATRTQKDLFDASASTEEKAKVFQDWLLKISDFLNADKVSKTNYLTSQLLEYIRANYEKPLSLYSIADEFNRSTPYISRLIKQTTGKNFTDLLTDLRIQKARELLKTSSYHVNEISRMVGYPNFRYFSRIFKQQTGMTPNDYRKIACRFH